MEMFKRGYFVVSLGALLSFVLVTGCTTFEPKPTIYVPEPALTLDKPLAKSLLVRVISEQPSEETLNFDPNGDPWILIPFCFYSSQNVNPMTKRNYLQNSLNEAFLRLFTKDLRASGLCGEVFVCEGGRGLKMNSSGTTYRLDIIVKHAVWHRNLTAYGLSYPGSILWALGAPVSYGHVDLEVKVALYAPGHPLEPVAVDTFKRRQSCVEWVYEQIGYQPAKSETILVDMFPGFAQNLRRFMKDALSKKK